MVYKYLNLDTFREIWNIIAILYRLRDDDTKPYYPQLTSKQVAEELGKIKDYYLQKEDEVEIKLTRVGLLQTHVEKTFEQNQTVRTKVFDYIKPVFQNSKMYRFLTCIV